MENSFKFKVNILLADDDPDDRELFTDTINDTAPKSSLLVFEDGLKLLNYLESTTDFQPDLIFLDINMPYLCGKQCLKEIRNNTRLDKTPVVILSTSSDENDIYETFKFGANLFITKPGSYSEQVDIFRRFFALFERGKLNDRTMSSFVLIPTVKITRPAVI